MANTITRGTTPVLQFQLPFSGENLKEIWVTFWQNGEVVLNKDIGTLLIEGDKITVRLTQKDTLLLSQSAGCSIQIRVLDQDDNAMASQIITCSVGKILKDGEIE